MINIYNDICEIIIILIIIKNNRMSQLTKLILIFSLPPSQSNLHWIFSSLLAIHWVILNKYRKYIGNPWREEIRSCSLPRLLKVLPFCPIKFFSILSKIPFQKLLLMSFIVNGRPRQVSSNLGMLESKILTIFYWLRPIFSINLYK